MEHTLGGCNVTGRRQLRYVLILVLVEHTLGDIKNVVTNTTKVVLILVLVEHTLGVNLYVAMVEYQQS